MTELLVLNVAQKVTPAVSLDGSRVHTLIDGLDEFLDGAVVDSQRGHICWTNMGIRDPERPKGQSRRSSPATDRSSASTSNGRNRRTIVARGTFTTGKQLTPTSPTASCIGAIPVLEERANVCRLLLEAGYHPWPAALQLRRAV